MRSSLYRSQEAKGGAGTCATALQHQQLLSLRHYAGQPLASQRQRSSRKSRRHNFQKLRAMLSPQQLQEFESQGVGPSRVPFAMPVCGLAFAHRSASTMRINDLCNRCWPCCTPRSQQQKAYLVLHHAVCSKPTSLECLLQVCETFGSVF